MKTLANPKDKAEILRRLKLIGPALPHRWGNMSAHQMICHLSDVFRSSMGEREASRASSWIPRLPMRWTALWLPFPWPHGFPARPEWDQRIGGTAPTQFEADMAELHRLFARFTEQPRSITVARSNTRGAWLGVTGFLTRLTSRWRVPKAIR